MRSILTGPALWGLLSLSSAAAWAQTSVTPLPPLVSSTEALKKGVPLHDEGKYSEAIAEYLKVPSSDTSYVDLQAELALSYYANKQYKEAIETAERAIRLGHESPVTYNTLASAQEETLGRATAEATYQRALKRFPYSQLLWYNLALTQDAANQPVAAFTSVQRSIQLKPTHAGSHLLLGHLAARQGQTTHAMLALITFLAVEPHSERSNGALVLLEQLASHSVQLEEGRRLDPLFENEEFQELDQLLDAKIALRKDYVTKVKFDANLVKQVQLLVEKFPAAPASGASFWQLAYGPMLKMLKDEETRTTFTYLILSAANDNSALKWVKSNESKVKKMASQVGPAIATIRTRQPVSYPGYPTSMSAWYDEDGDLFGLGEGTQPEGKLKPEGAWLLVKHGGAIGGEGKFGEGEKVGPWKFYYANGALEKSMSYDEKGLITGEFKSFRADGTPDVVGAYRNGQPHGPARLHYACGALHELRPYNEGNVEGVLETYYPDGQLQAKSQFKADKKHGKETGYYPDGSLEFEYEYQDGQRQGPFVVYGLGQKVERKGQFAADELQGAYSEYYDNGQLARTGTYQQGKETGTWKTYFRNGQPSEVLSYDEQGELHGRYEDYEDDGKLASVLEYNHGRLTSLSFFDKAGKELSRTALKKNTAVRGVYPTGVVAYTGSYQDGKKQGEWRYHRRDGSLRLVRTYQQGKVQGLSNQYYRNGQLESQQEYQDGVAQGAYQLFYLDGQRQRTGYYLQGDQEGQWRDYYADGTLSEEYALHADDNQGFAYSYSPTGKRTEERYYQAGRLLSQIAFDSTGAVLDRLELRPDTKELVLHYPNKKNRLVAALQCQERHGAVTWYQPNGRPEMQTNYRFGIQTGLQRTYYANGQLASEGTLRTGRREGEWKSYYESGKLRSVSAYHRGELEGEARYYFEDGKLEQVYTYQEGELHGSRRQYNMLGELVMERIYAHDEVTHYRPQVGSTEASGLQPIPSGLDYTLKTQFANGKPAAEETYKGGYLDGARTLYYSTGQVYRRSENRGGSLTGLLVTYYPTGQKQEEESYLHDEMHGRSRYYRPNGTLEREETYKAGEKAGVAVYYDVNGKPLRRDFYWNNYVYSTQ